MKEIASLEFLEGNGGWKGNHRVAMLLNNEIAGVIPVGLKEQNGEKRLQYDTGGYVSLSEWCCTRELSERDLRWVLTGVLEVLKEGEAFLLTPGCYFLRPDQIFLCPQNEKVSLCVRPEGEVDWGKEMLETGRFFLEAIDYKEEECVKLAYEFYHVSKREDLRPEDYGELLRSRVYTIIADDGEMAETHFSDATELARDEMDWIHIGAAGAEKFLPETREKMRRQEQRKRWLRGILTGIAVAIVVFVLYQSGF